MRTGAPFLTAQPVKAMSDRPLTDPIGSGVISSSSRALIIKTARSGTSRCGILHALRGLAATINVYCSHVSAHPMPDDMAELISQAWAQYDCNHAVFAPENVSGRVEQHAQRLTRTKLEEICRRMAPNAVPAPEVEAKVDQATTALTPKIPRRLDAMIAPFTTDQLDGASKLPLPNR